MAVPSRFLVQILLQLKGSGLVASVRGAAGGYQLARPPEQISVGDIINVIDRDPPTRTSPFSAPPSPSIEAVQEIWKEIQLAEQRILTQCSLADLVRRAQQSGPSSYQI